MKGKQRISKIAKDLLLNDERFNHVDSVAYGDLDMLHEIYERAGYTDKISHPLNKHQRVLNALDRESKQDNAIFEKGYFRSYKGLGRTFTLK
jgi:hypothetical protein